MLVGRPVAKHLRIEAPALQALTLIRFRVFADVENLLEPVDTGQQAGQLVPYLFPRQLLEETARDGHQSELRDHTATCTGSSVQQHLGSFVVDHTDAVEQRQHQRLG
uniref:Uncharacterized protein n=1 Tax=Anopheles atroparvus TaxID=41427 RepID=A0A182IPD1_ANOAO